MFIDSQFLLRFTDSMDNIKGALGRWRKKVGEATKKAEDLAGNTWQHCKFLTFSFCMFLRLSFSFKLVSFIYLCHCG